MPVERNFGPLDQIPLTDKALMREIGLMVRERIVRRTRQGIATDGSAFHAYSPAYAAKKSKELGTMVPNLTVSGAMLNDISILRVEEDEVELGFSK